MFSIQDCEEFTHYYNESSSLLKWFVKRVMFLTDYRRGVRASFRVSGPGKVCKLGRSSSIRVLYIQKYVCCTYKVHNESCVRLVKNFFD